MNNDNETFRTPVRQKKFLLVTFGIVSLIIIGLVFLMAKGPSDESIATDLVNEIMATLPAGDIPSSELRTAGRRFEEALGIAPNLQLAHDSLSNVQTRIENQIHQAILDGRIDDLDDLLMEATVIWPDQTQFQDTGIYQARIAEKRRELELQNRLRTRMSEMIARLENDPDKERSLIQAIDLIEGLLNPDPSVDDAPVPNEPLAALVQRTTDLTLATDDVSSTRRMLSVLDNASVKDESYNRLRDLLHQKLTEAKIERQIEELIAEAEDHLRGDRLSMPEGRNALFSYRQVLALAPEHPEAVNGIKRIEARYVALIDQSLVNNQLAAADSYISTLARVNPEHDELTRLRNKHQLLRENEEKELAQRNARRTQTREVSQPPEEEVVAEVESEMLDDDESKLWNQVRRSCNQGDLRKYINTYPSGRYVQDAWQRISDCLAAE